MTFLGGVLSFGEKQVEKRNREGWDGGKLEEMLEKQKPQQVRGHSVRHRVGERSRGSLVRGVSWVIEAGARREGAGRGTGRRGADAGRALKDFRLCSEMRSCWEGYIWKEKWDFKLFWREFLDNPVVRTLCSHC